MPDSSGPPQPQPTEPQDPSGAQTAQPPPPPPQTNAPDGTTHNPNPNPEDADEASIPGYSALSAATRAALRPCNVAAKTRFATLLPAHLHAAVLAHSLHDVEDPSAVLETRMVTHNRGPLTAPSAQHLPQIPVEQDSPEDLAIEGYAALSHAEKQILRQVDHTAKLRYLTLLPVRLRHVVIARGDLSGTGNPSAVFEKRMEMANGGPLVQTLESFAKMYNISEEDQRMLRCQPFEVQRGVIRMGGIADCWSHTLALQYRIQKISSELQQRQAVSLQDMTQLRRAFSSIAPPPRPQPQTFTTENNLYAPIPEIPAQKKKGSHEATHKAEPPMLNVRLGPAFEAVKLKSPQRQKREIKSEANSPKNIPKVEAKEEVKEEEEEQSQDLLEEEGGPTPATPVLMVRQEVRESEVPTMLAIPAARSTKRKREEERAGIAYTVPDTLVGEAAGPAASQQPSFLPLPSPQGRGGQFSTRKIATYSPNSSAPSILQTVLNTQTVKVPSARRVKVRGGGGGGGTYPQRR